MLKLQAPEIAVLPDHVRMDDIARVITDLNNVPIGIEKNTLAISTFDFNKNKISLVASQDNTLLDKFIASLVQVLQRVPGVEAFMFDANEGIKDTSVINNYYGNNYSEMIAKLQAIYDASNDKINIFVVSGLDTLKNGLSSEEQNKLNSILLGIKSKPNIRIVIADAIAKIKTFEYEDYYRENIQPINGIWIGSGITEQFTIKSSTYNKETRNPIPNYFGYNVTRGTAILIKILDFYTKD